jgi:hypothetical protein
MLECVTGLAASSEVSTSGNSTTEWPTNSTSQPEHFSAIFLQTAAAQGIAGVFAFSALLITCYHVSGTGISLYSLHFVENILF